MAKEKDIDLEKATGVSRREFLKMAGATAVGGAAGVLDWVATSPNPAMAATITRWSNTTCPYCSMGCGVLIGLDASGNAVDVIGDPESPINSGGLCSKGSSTIQLINNNRRVGVANSIHTASQTYGPMKRTGNQAWQAISWEDATTEIAAAMVSARETTASNTWYDTATAKVIGTANGVAFLGCSHMTNEQNWIYRKMIANFGTNNTEHQARI